MRGLRGEILSAALAWLGPPLVLAGAHVAPGGARPGVWLAVNLAILLGWYALSGALDVLGQTAAASALGRRVFSVTFGQGPLVAEGLVGRTRVSLRLVPLGGYVRTGTGQRERHLRNLWLSLAVGPVLHLAAALALWAVLGSRGFASLLVSPDFLHHPAVLQMLLLSQVLGLVGTFIPLRKASRKRRPERNGAALLRVPFLPPEQIDKFVEEYYFNEGYFNFLEGHYAKAIEFYLRAPQTPEDNPDWHHDLGMAYLMERQYAKARAHLVLVVGAPITPPRSRPAVMGAIAWVDLMLGWEELLPEAATFSEYALHCAPNSPSIKNARGAVLVKTGEIEEGAKLLGEVRVVLKQSGAPPQDVGYNACFLALAEAKRGRTDEAERYLAEARGLGFADVPWLSELEESLARPAGEAS